MPRRIGRRWPSGRPRFKERFGSVCVSVEGNRQFAGAFVDNIEGRAVPIAPDGMPRPCRSHGSFRRCSTTSIPAPGYSFPNWLESRLLKPFVPEHMLTGGAGLEITLGGAGSSPTIHRHQLQTETFIVQIQGRQESVLYFPDQAPSCYR